MGASASEGSAFSVSPAPEQRSAENPAVPLSQITSWNSFFGGHAAPAHAGVVVTPESAMRVSAVYACLNRIASTIAMLSIGVYKETDAGRDLDKTDPLQQLFTYGLDELMNRFNFMHMLVARAWL